MSPLSHAFSDAAYLAQFSTAMRAIYGGNPSLRLSG
jgi:hypothetical protein